MCQDCSQSSVKSLPVLRSCLSPDASSGAVSSQRSGSAHPAAEAALHGGGGRDGPWPAGIPGEPSRRTLRSSPSAFTVFLQVRAVSGLWAEPVVK